jgi:dTDP-glucose 4,6-dehydratase
MNILVTGGCGFIGSHFIEEILNNKEVKTLINLDKLTYAANGDLPFATDPRYKLVIEDINNPSLLELLISNEIEYVVHFAAESHVDNSIDNSDPFIHTNINGTHNLLKNTVKYGKLKKFIHVSTDEVFGSLDFDAPAFNLDSQYKPNNPYSASKAASDLLVRSFVKTHKLPAVITNCSNNFGPRQFSEKLIPVVISKLIKKEAVPLYGNGQNIRDWIYVKDHARALIGIMLQSDQERYLIGGDNEVSNIQLINQIANLYCDISNTKLDWIWYKQVADRKGHDLRYSINNDHLIKHYPDFQLTKFNNSMLETIKYYINKL